MPWGNLDDILQGQRYPMENEYSVFCIPMVIVFISGLKFALNVSQWRLHSNHKPVIYRHRDTYIMYVTGIFSQGEGGSKLGKSLLSNSMENICMNYVSRDTIFIWVRIRIRREDLILNIYGLIYASSPDQMLLSTNA
jgi:hypothetical protein